MSLKVVNPLVAFPRKVFLNTKCVSVRKRSVYLRITHTHTHSYARHNRISNMKKVNPAFKPYLSPSPHLLN